MRITAFPGSEIAIPALAIEYAAFGQIVLYVNFAPRTDLVCLALDADVGQL